MSTTTMLARRVSLTQYLVEQQRKHGRISAELRLLIEVVSRACKSIAIAVNQGALGGVLGSAGSENVQGEVPSEEMASIHVVPNRDPQGANRSDTSWFARICNAVDGVKAEMRAPRGVMQRFPRPTRHGSISR